MVIPIKPTHMGTEVVPLFKDKWQNPAADAQLPPFTVVTVVKGEPSWLLAVRGGKLLGYAGQGRAA